jgi:hypothetical protein
MGGVLLIRDEPSKALWLPQSSTYDALLEQVAAEIGDAELAQRLLASRLEVYGGYAAIDDLDETRFSSFTGAVRDALANTASESASASLAELLALLRTDPRARETDAKGTIVLDEDRRWTAPLWLVDFIATHLGEPPSDGVVDIRGRAADLRPRVEWMRERYGDGEGRGGHAPPVYARIAEAVNAFSEALRLGR